MEPETPSTGFDGFVHSHGTGFLLGGQPLLVAGANNYYLSFESDAMVVAVFELARNMGLNTLRTGAFLDCGPAALQTGPWFHSWDAAKSAPAYNDGPTGLERLDRTIQLAEHYGIRLILPLVNYWPDFGGVDQYLQWFGLTDRVDFFRHPAPKGAYRAWAEHLLLRTNTRTGRQYREEPAIFAWELANEPRCVGRDGDALPGGVDILLNWAHEMSAFLKSLDSNHLVGVGDEGWFARRFAWGNPLYNGAHGADCEALLAIPTIDFGTFHLYPAFAPKEAPEAFGARWIREHQEVAAAAGKPMLLEEFGVKGNSPVPRAGIFQRWLDEIAVTGGAGALLWMIAAAGHDRQPYPDYDGYTVYSAGEVPALVAFARSASTPGASPPGI